MGGIVKYVSEKDAEVLNKYLFEEENTILIFPAASSKAGAIGIIDGKRELYNFKLVGGDCFLRVDQPDHFFLQMIDGTLDDEE